MVKMVKTGLTRPYADSMEVVDFDKLQEFAAHSDFFDRVEPPGVHCGGIDAIGKRADVTYAIELKTREYVHQRFESWFLEADKYAELMRHSRGNIRPVYINFFPDGWTAIWCIDPDKGGIDPGEPVKDRWVKNPGTTGGEIECTTKYLLPIKDAVLYDENFRRRQ